MDLPDHAVLRPHVHNKMDDKTKNMMKFLNMTLTGRRWHTILKRNETFGDREDLPVFVTATFALDAMHDQFSQDQPVTDNWASLTIQQWREKYQLLARHIPAVSQIVRSIKSTRFDTGRNYSLRRRLTYAFNKHPVPAHVPSLLENPLPMFPGSGTSTPSTVMSGFSTPMGGGSGYDTPATRPSALGSPVGWMSPPTPSRTATPASTSGSATPVSYTSASGHASAASRTPARAAPTFDQRAHANDLIGALERTLLRADFDWGTEEADWYHEDDADPSAYDDAYAPPHNAYTQTTMWPQHSAYSRPTSTIGPDSGVSFSNWTVQGSYSQASVDPMQLINDNMASVPGNPANLRNVIRYAAPVDDPISRYYRHR